MTDQQLGEVVTEHRFSGGEKAAAVVSIPLFIGLSAAGFLWMKDSQGQLVGLIGAFFVVFFVVRLVMFTKLRVRLHEHALVHQRASKSQIIPLDQVTVFDWRLRKVRGFDQNHLAITAADGRSIYVNETISNAAELGEKLAERLEPYLRYRVRPKRFGEP